MKINNIHQIRAKLQLNLFYTTLEISFLDFWKFQKCSASKFNVLCLVLVFSVRCWHSGQKLEKWLFSCSLCCSQPHECSQVLQIHCSAVECQCSKFITIFQRHANGQSWCMQLSAFSAPEQIQWQNILCRQTFFCFDCFCQCLLLSGELILGGKYAELTKLRRSCKSSASYMIHS